jgi:ATP-dependent Clp protease ATP-binding subunit ClpA
MEPRKRHPVGLFNAHAKRVFVAAQRDADRRGGKVLVSGLILYAAANAGDRFSARLLEAMGTDLDTLNSAVDAEWSSRSVWLQDQPFSLLNEAFQKVVADSGTRLRLGTLLAATLGYPDSMASRVVKRIGIEPAILAPRLASDESR